jgi:hypothetical protein
LSSLQVFFLYSFFPTYMQYNLFRTTQPPLVDNNFCCWRGVAHKRPIDFQIFWKEWTSSCKGNFSTEGFSAGFASVLTKESRFCSLVSNYRISRQGDVKQSDTIYCHQDYIWITSQVSSFCVSIMSQCQILTPSPNKY